MTIGNKIAVIGSLVASYGLLATPSFAQSWQWQHPGMYGTNGMLNVSVLTRKNVDWAPGSWKGECSGRNANGIDPVGTEIFQGFATGRYDPPVWGTGYGYVNAILCTNADKMNGMGWTVDKFNSVTLDIANGNDQRGSWHSNGDWAYGLLKGECPDGYAVTGIAQTGTADSDITKVLCSKISKAHPSWCATLWSDQDEFGWSVGEWYGNYTFSGQDWNYNHHKVSCWADTYAAGIAVLPNIHEASQLLCCQ